LALEGLNERDAATKAIHMAVKAAALCKRVMWMAFSIGGRIGLTLAMV
jgi:hypothetical protein